MKLLTVLPIVTHTYAQHCVASLLRPDSAAGLDPSEILVVDNTREGDCAARYGLRTYRDPDNLNIGCGRAWNVGASEMLDGNAEYLLLMSASMLWGPILHTTLRDQIVEFWGAPAIEKHIDSWHCIALHRSLFERIGLFDPAYWPAYEEQVDWCYRLRMAGLEHSFVRISANGMSQAVAGHIDAVGSPSVHPLLAYYALKFGGPKGEETLTRPWGKYPLDYFEEEAIPVLAERYGLGPRYGKWW